MANWLYEIDFSHDFRRCQNNEINVLELVEKIIQKINKILPLIEKKFQSNHIYYKILVKIKNDFQEFLNRQDEDIDYFDEILNELYDWGDLQLSEKWPPDKLCWIGAI